MKSLFERALRAYRKHVGSLSEPSASALAPTNARCCGVALGGLAPIRAADVMRWVATNITPRRAVAAPRSLEPRGTAPRSLEPRGTALRRARPRRTTALRWVGFVLMLLLLAACAEERPAINRVQPNAVEKAFFVGALDDAADDPEFYAKATLVDVPYGTRSGLFSGVSGSLVRVRWEIQEETLLARLAYELVEDTEGRGARLGGEGTVVAAFPIESHFDVSRAYNSSTGEEYNVIEENTSDRAWYARRFMRVNWAKNLIQSSLSFDPLAFDNLLGSNYRVEPVDYFDADPNSPDAPRFSPDEGYFDVTQKLYVTPATLNVAGTVVPTCLWSGVFSTGGSAETSFCEATEVKVRLAFRRVPEPMSPGHTDYLPMPWDGARMDAFGAFYVERKGYDRSYGVIDDRWFRYAIRHNVWEKSTTDVPCASDAGYGAGLDPQRDEDEDGTDDECAKAGAGAQCSVVLRRCSLPYAQRTTRPSIWRYHGVADERIVQATRAALLEWDTALRVAVQAARYEECVRTRAASLAGTPFGAAPRNESAARETCRVVFPIDSNDGAELARVRERAACEERRGRDAPECAPKNARSVAALPSVATFCHETTRGPERDAAGELVYAGDDPACGAPGTTSRVGDLRYHELNVWPTPESSAPWGFGPVAADPLTGEVIQGSMNVYAAVTDRASREFVDRVLWFAGELDTQALTSGEWVRSWASVARSESFMPRFSRSELDARALGTSHADPVALARAHAPGLEPELLRAAEALRQELRDSQRLPPQGAGLSSEYAARLKGVFDSPLHERLLGPMWTEASALPPTAPPEARRAVSPIGPQGPLAIAELSSALGRSVAARHTCVYHAPEPSSTPALAKRLLAKFPAPRERTPEARAEHVARMTDWVRGKLHHGLVLHELGHTFGLRHNFASSADAVNYSPQYWQLRTQGGQVTRRCTEVSATGSDCVGPRYFDPETPEETREALHMWSQTSVMDYAGDLAQSFVGLGVYDYAALRMLYADVVDVRDDGVSVEDPVGRQLASMVDDLSAHWVEDGNRFIHYSEYARFFDLLQSCRRARVSAPPNWNERREGRFDEALDGGVVRQESCSRPWVDYVAWRRMVPERVTSQRSVDPLWFSVRRPYDRFGRPRVPYAFGSDEFADGWLWNVHRNDVGADAYEQATFYMSRYENEHVFDNYRRNRVGFSIAQAYSSALQGFHFKLGYLGQSQSFYHDFYVSELAKNTGLSRAALIAELEGPDGPLRENAVAASLVFDHFVRVLTRPQAGRHYANLPGRGELWSAADGLIGADVNPLFNPSLVIPNGTARAGQSLTFGGRPLTNAFQYGRGYFYYEYVDRAGSFYEKTWATEPLLSAFYRAPHVFSQLDGIDGRWRHTNFTNLYPDGMRRLLGIALTQDWALLGPRVSADANGRPEVEPDASGAPFPKRPLGWVSFTDPRGPRVCWPESDVYTCTDPSGAEVVPAAGPSRSVVIDPQLGYEVQKFIALWAWVYLPTSQDSDYADSMRIYKAGRETNPYLPSESVEWRDPESGLRYVARRYGSETLLGKTYDRGIAAKMIQWANQLTARAYELDEAAPFDPVTGAVNPRLDSSGRPVVRRDPSLTPQGEGELTCADNRACGDLRGYRGLLDFMHALASDLDFPGPNLDGD